MNGQCAVNEQSIRGKTRESQKGSKESKEFIMYGYGPFMYGSMPTFPPPKLTSDSYSALLNLTEIVSQFAQLAVLNLTEIVSQFV